MKLLSLIFLIMFSLPVFSMMSQEEIIKGFEAPEKTMRFDRSFEDRKKNLAPESIFFSTKKIMKKKGEIKSQKFEGKGADLSAKDAPVVNQWNGTCTAHGLAGVMENFIGNIDLSERHIWSGYKQYSCEAAIKAWENGKCVTTEKAWPHDSTKGKAGYTKPENCNTYLKKTTYIGDDIQAAINSLDKGHPVYIGMNVTESMMNCDATISPKSKKVEGGHALAIVGYYLDNRVLGGGYFKVKNSWGTDCGDSGYQYVPFYHCQRDDLYCILWTIDDVRHVDNKQSKK